MKSNSHYPINHYDDYKLNEDLESISRELNQTRVDLGKIQRDDGCLRDGSVTLPSLSQEVLTLICGFNLRGLLQENAQYRKGDIVAFKTAKHYKYPELFVCIKDVDLFSFGGFAIGDKYFEHFARFGTENCGCEEKKEEIEVGKDEVEVGKDEVVFDMDYMVLTYNFTDGEDLDTRTRIVSPDIGMDFDIGWNRKANFGDYIIWGGDNRGVGVESVLINVARIKQDFPDAREIKIDTRAFWYSRQGNNDVSLIAHLYKGGKMIKDEYTWINNTASKNIVFQTSGKKIPGPAFVGDWDGHHLAWVTYNLLTKKVSFDLSS